jgi:ABC-type multidrug transport system fused ATPase/permease subunit
VLQIYGGLWRYVRGDRWVLGLALSLLAVSEATSLTQPWLTGKAVDALQRHGWLGLADSALFIGELVGCMVLSWVIQGFARIVELRISLRTKAAFVVDIASRILGAPPPWHRDHHPMDNSQKLVQSAQALTEFGQNQYSYLQSIIALLGPIIALSMFSPWIAAIALVGHVALISVAVWFDRVLLNLRSSALELERRFFFLVY